MTFNLDTPFSAPAGPPSKELACVAFAALALLAGCPAAWLDDLWRKMGPLALPVFPSQAYEQFRQAVVELADEKGQRPEDVEVRP